MAEPESNSGNSGQPVDIWKRLKKLTKERKKIADRIRRINDSIAIRSSKLNEIGEKYGQLTFAMDKLKEELSKEQIDLVVKLLNLLSTRIEELTRDISELSEPNILLFAEYEEVEAEIAALQSIINAEKPESKESQD